MSFYALIPTPVVLMALLVICLGGCGDVMIGPNDPRPSPVPPASVPELIDALEDPDPMMRLSAVTALGRLGTEAGPAVPALTKILTNTASTSEMRIAVAYTLRDIGPSAASAAPELVKMVHTDINKGARAAAAGALGGLGDTSVVPDLAAVLYDADASRSLMIAAARAIAALTSNSFTDSQPGSGVRFTEDGTPFLILEARSWWESEGQYQEWTAID
jgi:HEAT repeat protein